MQSAVADGKAGQDVILAGASEIAIPTIVLGKWKFGILGSRKRSQYENWLSDFLGSCRVLVVDSETATQYAEVRDVLKHRGNPIPANDLWIASLARQYALP